MLPLLKQLVGYAVLMIVVIIAATWMPRHLQRAQVPENGGEVSDLHGGATYALDMSTSPAGLTVGLIVAFRMGGEEDGASHFARIAALPGQRVEIRNRMVHVEGNPSAAKPNEVDSPDHGPLVVPAGHLYVLSANAEADSRSLGPIPAGAILGRIHED